MIFYNNNGGLKRGWYYHQVAGKCDNCDKGFNESGGVLNADTLQTLCHDCYHIVNYPTKQNKKWIKRDMNNNSKKEKKEKKEDRIVNNPFSEDDVPICVEPYEYDYE